MNHVLVIAYYFPPSGGPGVQRALKHVQYLSEFGWKPVVLTVSNGDFPARDVSLMEKIPHDVHVERTEILEPYNIYRALTGKSKDVPLDVNNIKKDGQKRSVSEHIAEIVRSTFFIPDARVGWLIHALPAARRLLQQFPIAAVYSSSPPYTCSLIARAIKREYGLPWVAGFRDPWTDFLTTPRRWFLPKWIDRNLEHTVFREADVIESAWQGITLDALKKYKDLPSKKFVHIPNGFDSADFPDPYPHGKNSRFTLTYTGSLYGKRNPMQLFSALELLLSRNELNKEDFLLQFVGRMGAEITDMIDNTSFKSSVEIIPYLPHIESIRKLQQADALLLIVDEAKESEEIVPGKVFEYIGVQKPVLALAPEHGAIAGIIRDTSSGFVANQRNVEKIAECILKLFLGWKHDNAVISQNRSEVLQYERKQAAKKLSHILDELTKE